MRLIDADKLLSDNDMGVVCSACGQNEYECGNYHNYTLMDFCNMVDIAPTVDAEPVTNGEWISEEADVLFRCSICGAQVSTGWDYEGAWNYCPACGARMCGSYENETDRR
jgi:DNA-directed RNA polymerase subunit RPC12/RpoP